MVFKKRCNGCITAFFIFLFAQSQVQNSLECQHKRVPAGKETAMTLSAVWLIDYKLYILE